jgi:hypothetical protein
MSRENIVTCNLCKATTSDHFDGLKGWASCFLSPQWWPLLLSAVRVCYGHAPRT